MFKKRCEIRATVAGNLQQEWYATKNVINIKFCSTFGARHSNTYVVRMWTVLVYSFLKTLWSIEFSVWQNEIAHGFQFQNDTITHNIPKPAVVTNPSSIEPLKQNEHCYENANCQFSVSCSLAEIYYHWMLTMDWGVKWHQNQCSFTCTCSDTTVNGENETKQTQLINKCRYM